MELADLSHEWFIARNAMTRFGKLQNPTDEAIAARDELMRTVNEATVAVKEKTDAFLASLAEKETDANA